MRFVRYLFLSLVFSSFSISANTIRGQLEKIPKEDQEGIRFLFQHMFYMTPCPFTLFGTKPISLVDLTVKTHPFLCC